MFYVTVPKGIVSHRTNLDRKYGDTHCGMPYGISDAHTPKPLKRLCKRCFPKGEEDEG